MSLYANDVAIVLKKVCKLKYSSKVACIPLREDELQWADVILCVKGADKIQLEKYYSKYAKKANTLGIPDIVEEPLSLLIANYLRLEVRKSLADLIYTPPTSPP